MASDAEIPLPGRSGDWSASAVTTATITASPPNSRSIRFMENLRNFSGILGTGPPVKRWNERQFAALATLANCLGQRGDAFVELGILDQNRWQEPDHGPATGQDEDAPLLHRLDHRGRRFLQLDGLHHPTAANLADLWHPEVAHARLKTRPGTGCAGMKRVICEHLERRGSRRTDQWVTGEGAAVAPLGHALADRGRDRVVQHRVQCIEVIERDVADTLQHRSERISVLRVGGGGEGAEGAPVVGPMRGNDADAPGGDARELERGLDRLGSRVSKRDPSQGWGQQRPQRVKEVLARRRIEALMGIGQVRRLVLDGIGHQRVRVPKKIDAVIGHQVEVPPVLVVPQIGPLAANKGDAPARVQRDRAELGVRGGQVVTHVPAPSNARVSGCSPRPSSSPTAWMPRRMACAAASSLTLARPLPYSATRSTSSRRMVGITLPSSLMSRMKPGVSAKISRRSALSALAISIARRSPSTLIATPS